MKKAVTATLFAAAVVITSGVASAQTTQLRADIPFAFHAGSRTVSAGRYVFRHNVSAISTAMYTMTNATTGEAMILMANSPVQSKGDKLRPGQIDFVCSGEECALSQVWDGGTATGYRFTHHLTPREKEYKQVAILVTSGSAR